MILVLTGCHTENKEIIENKLIDFVMGNELEGIVIDFKKFKATDKDLLEQYIKGKERKLRRAGYYNSVQSVI